MSLPLTGERTVPGLPHENYWFRRHEAAYRALVPLCVGMRVLDAGCGEGYGAAAAHRAGAWSVVALDYDAAAVGHAHRGYGQRSSSLIEGQLLGIEAHETAFDQRGTGAIAAIRGNLVDLPFADDAFDVVLSLQTVEHLWNQPRFVAECARVLRPGGRLALTTPNRLTFPPGNLFHARELDAGDLERLVAAAPLRVETMLGLRHGIRIAEYEQTNGDIVAAQLGEEPERWPEPLGAFVASITAADFVLDRHDVDSSLDLCVVALRLPPSDKNWRAGNVFSPMPLDAAQPSAAPGGS